MLSDVPNFAFAFGYTNASWTLKVDLTYSYIWRLLRHMDAHRPAVVCAAAARRLGDRGTVHGLLAGLRPAVDRQASREAGSKAPWRLRQNYLFDLTVLSRGSVDDGTMEFGTGLPRRDLASSVRDWS